MASDVEKYDYVAHSFLDLVKENAKKAITSLEYVISEFNIWFEQDENYGDASKMSDTLFGNEQQKFCDILDELLNQEKFPNCIYHQLEMLYEQMPMDACNIAEELRPHFDQLMKLFRRSSKETPNQETFRKAIPQYESPIDEYTKKFGLEAISKDILQSRPNPMHVEFSFEK